MPTPKRTLYQGTYRSQINDEPDNLDTEPTGDNSNTLEENPATPEEKVWQKRYGDLRTHSNKQTERVRELERLLQDARRQDIKLPSTQSEMEDFTKRYPDVVRHIQTLAIKEILQQKEDFTSEAKRVHEDLEKVTRELGEKKLLTAHPDFNELNSSQEFHDWAMSQPKVIQDWLYDSADPELCIKAIDMYKAEKGFKEKKEPPQRKHRADVQVPTRSTIEIEDKSNKKIWKVSEIQALHPKLYEKYEDDIELARTENRIDMNA